MDIDKLSTRLQRIYPKHYKSALEDVIGIIEKWKRYEFKKYPLVTEKDLVLIAYGDSFQESNEAPLMTLHRFMTKHVKNSIENIHILPMFPYTSDDGFSVVNYREINPELGTWADIIRLKKSYNLMFDAVINHASKSSEYFKKFLEEDDKYKEFFIIADPNKDYSQVIRPRALPLLTVFQTATRKVHIWTTFSEDQVDLNFKNPKVLSD